MSYPSWPIPSTKAAQDDFHRVVEKIGLCQRSPAAQKMNRLRDLSPAEMQDMIQGGITWPQWDPEWFSQYGKQLLDEFQFAPWVERVVIGHTRDENALLSMFLPLKSTTEVIECVRKLVPEKTFADAILDAYHISSEIEVSQALKSFCQLATDSEFGVAPYTVSDTQTCPVHLYRFDQTDDFESSPFRGHAYHALDNVFFCRLPAVAGPGAPESAGATSDALSSALAKTIYGSEPWPEYKQSGKLMVFDGPNSGVIMQENPKRWENLVETEEQRLMFASIMPTLYSTML